MNSHTFRILEYDKVIAAIRGNCLTPFGSEAVAEIAPLDDLVEVRRRIDEISQMKDIVIFGDPFPLSRQPDCREAISQAKVEGAILDPKELLEVVSVAVSAIELHRYRSDERENFPLIAAILERLRAFPELPERVFRAIDETGEVKDTASRELKRIRMELADTRRRITGRLQQLVGDRPKKAGWQDDIVTLRNDRYVISVPSSQYTTSMGILHDRSQSGATLFVEPSEVVEYNNRIHLLQQDERAEIVRILRELTGLVGERSAALIENCRLIGELDRLHACARHSEKIRGHAPRIVEAASLALRQARHPLLVAQIGDASKVVPNTLNLDASRQVLLVTGPNTGGKTVLLKTIGLSLVMARSGLHISADDDSEVGLFDHIHADIGDEQSIELSLSTFSSHVTNIVRGLRHAGPSSLLLFDEIGAGTDPVEGAALAESIIRYGIAKGCRMIVTTHYSQLKTLAMDEPMVENASLDFDRETLAPTYALKIGLPGSSYAIEIAGRLGMPKEICDNAARMVGTEERSLAQLISSLEAELKLLKSDKTELEERLTKARQLEDYYRVQSEKIDRESAEIRKNALADTESFLNETRRDVERLVAEIRKSQASADTVKEFHQKLRSAQQEIGRTRTRTKAEPKVDNTVFERGDRVRILSLGQDGVIDEMLTKNRARVKVGSVYTTAETRNLTKLEEPAASQPRRTPAVSFGEETVSREIHLLGMTVEEATEALEKFLDLANVHGLAQVYVVHGKGTGALRRALTEFLRSHRLVASVRLGNWNEGGAGVSVVRLRE